MKNKIKNIDQRFKDQNQQNTELIETFLSFETKIVFLHENELCFHSNLASMSSAMKKSP